MVASSFFSVAYPLFEVLRRLAFNIGLVLEERDGAALVPVPDVAGFADAAATTVSLCFSVALIADAIDVNVDLADVTDDDDSDLFGNFPAAAAEDSDFFISAVLDVDPAAPCLTAADEVTAVAVADVIDRGINLFGFFAGAAADEDGAFLDADSSAAPRFTAFDVEAAAAVADALVAVTPPVFLLAAFDADSEDAWSVLSEDGRFILACCHRFRSFMCLS